MKRELVVSLLALAVLSGTTAAADAGAPDSLAMAPELGQVPDLLPEGIDPDNTYAKSGYLDVTLYGADPTGVEDSTEELQAAIDDAYTNGMVVFFPSGTYVVSNALRMMKTTIPHDDRQAHQLVGSTDGPRPVIKLVDDAPGFDDTSVVDWRPAARVDTTLKAVLHFWQQEREGVSDPVNSRDGLNMHQQVRGIDIDLGDGNPGAVGIRHRGAEVSSIQDVKIDATGGFAGIYSLIGSGGSITNLEVEGGQYGVYVNQARPGALITGIKLSGQEDRAILNKEHTPITVVGFDIEADHGPVVSTERVVSVERAGNIALIDGRIRLSNVSDEPVVTNTDRMVYMENVYVRNARTVVENSGDGSSVSVDDPAVWNRVEEYAYGKGGFREEMKIVDGVKTDETQVKLVNDSGAPPADLVSKHVWDRTYWTFEDDDVLSVADFGAVGDGVTDDTQAIQDAIDAAAEAGTNKVFIPRGHYRVSDTIKLRRHTKLFGISSWLSALVPTGWMPDENTPIIESANSVKSTNMLANMRLVLFGTQFKVYGLKWMAGAQSIVNQVFVHWLVEHENSDEWWRGEHVLQRSIITGNGGGRWYNYTTDIPNQEGVGSRGVLIDGTNQPLRFYMFQNQHVGGDAISEVRNSSNVTFFSVKSEDPGTLIGLPRPGTTMWPSPLKINNSSNVKVYTYTGLAEQIAGRGLIEITESTAVTVSNMSRIVTRDGFDPTTWYHVSVTTIGVPRTIGADLPVSLVKTAAPDLDGIRTRLDRYIDAGELTDPLAAFLSRALDRAENDLEEGSIDQASKQLKGFLKLLSSKGLQQHSTEEARSTLHLKANQLLAFWTR